MHKNIMSSAVSTQVIKLEVHLLTRAFMPGTFLLEKTHLLYSGQVLTRSTACPRQFSALSVCAALVWSRVGSSPAATTERLLVLLYQRAGPVVRTQRARGPSFFGGGRGGWRRLAARRRRTIARRPPAATERLHGSRPEPARPACRRTESGSRWGRGLAAEGLSE